MAQWLVLLPYRHQVTGSIPDRCNQVPILSYRKVGNNIDIPYYSERHDGSVVSAPVVQAPSHRFDYRPVHRSQCSQKRKQQKEKTGQRERRKREREKIKKTEQTVRWRAEGKTTVMLNHLNLQNTNTSTTHTHTHRADCCCCKSDKRRVRIRVFVLEKVSLKRQHQSQMTPAGCNTRDVYLSVCVVCACVARARNW